MGESYQLRECPFDSGDVRYSRGGNSPKVHNFLVAEQEQELESRFLGGPSQWFLLITTVTN